MPLKGKHALITGSSRGIGRGIALKLAKQGVKVAGFNTQRLERLHDGLRRFVDSGEYAGIVSLFMRGGQVADVYVYGMEDIENKISMGRDTICRMYSQSTRLLA